MFTEDDLAILNEKDRQEFWFTFQQLGHEDMLILRDCLVSNPNAFFLNLNGNNIGDEGGIVIADLIQKSNLQFVNLAGNNIGDEGAIAIAKALFRNQNLISINLLGNRITNRGARALAQMINENRTLQKLYLYLNLIEDEGCMEISKAVVNNRTLQTLWLDHNPISMEVASQIVSIVSQNHFLIDFELTVLNESLDKQERDAISKFRMRNLDLKDKRLEICRDLFKFSRLVMASNLVLFPFEIQSQILMSDVEEDDSIFNANERSLISDCLLARDFVGSFTNGEFSTQMILNNCLKIVS